MPRPQSDRHTVNATAPAVFEHTFDVKDQDMRGLYEKAKRDQWNASRDIDWSQDLDPDRGIVADGLIDIYGTKYWDRLSPKQRAELNRHFSAWRISQLMYGEEFAMLLCGQLVNIVPGIDAKFFLATQVMDEARHSEVLARYLHDKAGVVYPLTPHLKTEVEDIQHLRREIAQKNEYAMFRQRFKRDFHSSLWNNLSRVGLMSERVMERLGAMGLTAPQQSAAA